jgi:hypothetical protein
MTNDDDISFIAGAPHPHVDFDFEAIEAEPDEPIVLDMGEETVDRLIIALDAVLDWLVPHRAKPQTVMIRACVLALFVRPDALGCKNQRELARKLGVSRWVINRQVIEFRDQFNWIAPRMHGAIARKRMKTKRNERNSS